MRSQGLVNCKLLLIHVVPHASGKKAKNSMAEMMQLVLPALPYHSKKKASFLGVTLDEHLTWDVHCNTQ